jgi:hypothetical protein
VPLAVRLTPLSVNICGEAVEPVVIAPKLIDDVEAVAVGVRDVITTSPFPVLPTLFDVLVPEL